MARPKNPAQKEKLTIWLEPDVARGLRRSAAEFELSLSETANTFLRKAVITHELEITSDAVGKRLEALVKKAMAGVADSLSYLTSVAAIEAGSIRRVMYQDLLDRHGADKTRSWNQQARKDTVRKLKDTPDEFLQMILDEHARAKSQEVEGA